MPACLVDQCGQVARKRGWCAAHYSQQRRTGRPPEPFKYKWGRSGLACVVCGVLVPERSRRRRFCSGRCQMLESRGRREFPAAVAPSFRCSLCDVEVDLFAPGVSHKGGPSTRKRRADSSVCEACARRRSYRHRFSARVLARRDGADCRLCSLPVDLGLRFPDPMAPSVDHVVSRAEGGSDDPANLQLAHLRCNHLKSKRSGWSMVSGRND